MMMLRRVVALLLQLKYHNRLNRSFQRCLCKLGATKANRVARGLALSHLVAHQGLLVVHLCLHLQHNIRTEMIERRNRSILFVHLPPWKQRPSNCNIIPVRVQATHSHLLHRRLSLGDAFRLPRQCLL